MAYKKRQSAQPPTSQKSEREKDQPQNDPSGLNGLNGSNNNILQSASYQECILYIPGTYRQSTLQTATISRRIVQPRQLPPELPDRFTQNRQLYIEYLNHYRQLRNKNATGDKRKIVVGNKRKIINPCIFGSIFAKLPLKCQSTARSIWSVRITFYLDSAQMMSSPALVCLSV